jgi:hypothetical protein
MTAHARLSASGADRWMLCPGSVAATATHQNTSSAFAAEGTAAHELAEHCLQTRTDASSHIDKTFGGIEVDPLMAEAVQEYLNYVNQFSGHHFYEVRLDLSAWVPDGFGTADAVVIDGDTIRVIDLKFGKGIEVDAPDNRQLMLYALGALDAFGDLAELTTVTLAIIQPRRDHISEHALTVQELLAFGDDVKRAALLALQPDAPRQPGDKQCQWCTAKATCPALLRHAEAVLLSQFDDFAPPPVDTLTNTQLAAALSAKRLITGWLDAVEQLIVGQLLDGQSVPGYKLVAGRSLRQWVDESQAETALAELVPADKLYTRKLISVAQAEKLLKRAKLPQDLVTKPEGKPTLAPADDPRPELGATINDFDACNP